MLFNGGCRAYAVPHIPCCMQQVTPPQELHKKQNNSECVLTSFDTSALASFWLSNMAAMNSLKLMPSVWESTCRGGSTGQTTTAVSPSTDQRTITL